MEYLIEKHTGLPNRLRNLYSNLKSANFQDYAQTPQRKINVHEFGFRSPLAVSATTHFLKPRSDENFYNGNCFSTKSSLRNYHLTK